AHDSRPTDGASQHRLIEDEPKPQRRTPPLEDSLTTETQVNPPRHVHLGLLRPNRAEHASGIVGGLQEAVDRLRLEDVERLRLRLKADICAQRRSEDVVVLLPPTLLLCLTGQLNEPRPNGIVAGEPVNVQHGADLSYAQDIALAGLEPVDAGRRGLEQLGGRLSRESGGFAKSSEFDPKTPPTDSRVRISTHPASLISHSPQTPRCLVSEGLHLKVAA